MGWYPCSCCCVERVLIWERSYGFTNAAGYWNTDLGLVVHFQSQYTGNISDYQLVVWDSPIADSSWWPTIRDGNWSGRLVILSNYKTDLDPPGGTWDYVDGLAAYTGIEFTGSTFTSTAITLDDPLTDGITFNGSFSATLSGGTTLATQSGLPTIARNRSDRVQYVVAGYPHSLIDSGGFWADAEQWALNLWNVDHVPCGSTPMYVSDLNGGVDFSFTSGLLTGTGSASGGTTAIFDISGLLFDEDAGRMGGDVDATFTVSGEATAAAALAGSSGLTFTTSSATFASAALTGTTTLTFTTSTAHSAIGNLVGDSATCLQFSTAGILTVFGVQTGTTTLTFSPSGVLTGTLPTLSGATTLTFTASAAMRADYSVAGTTTLTFTETAALGGSGSCAGSTSLTFTCSAGNGASAPGSGIVSLTFTTSAAMAGTAPVTGTTTLTFTTSAAGNFAGALDGDCQLSFLIFNGALRGTGTASGTTTLTFTESGAMRSNAPVSGSSSLTFSTSGQLKGTAAADGACQLSFLIFTSPLTGAGRLVGTSTLTFTPQGRHTAQVNISGSCQTTFLLLSSALRGTAGATGHCQLSFLLLSSSLRGTGRLSGSSSLNFTTSATGRVQSVSTGSTSLTFSTQGSLKGAGRCTGTTTLTFTCSGSTAGSRGKLISTAQMTFTPSGDLTGTSASWSLDWAGGVGQFTGNANHPDYNATYSSDPGFATNDICVAVTVTAATGYDINTPELTIASGTIVDTTTLRESGRDATDGFGGHHIIVAEHAITSASGTGLPGYDFSSVDPASDLGTTVLFRIRRGTAAFGAASATVDGSPSATPGAPASVTVNYPTGIQSGDLLVICLTYESDGDQFLPSASGFTGINGEDSTFGTLISLARAVNSCILVRTATGSESGSVTVNAVGPGAAGFTWYGCQAMMLRYR